MSVLAKCGISAVRVWGFTYNYKLTNENIFGGIARGEAAFPGKRGTGHVIHGAGAATGRGGRLGARQGAQSLSIGVPRLSAIRTTNAAPQYPPRADTSVVGRIDNPSYLRTRWPHAGYSDSGSLPARAGAAPRRTTRPNRPNHPDHRTPAKKRPNPAKSGQKRPKPAQHAPHDPPDRPSRSPPKRPKPAMPKNHRNDTALILALAAGASIAQAAEAAGISERTVRRCAADPAVRAEIAAMTAAARAVVATLATAASEAATTLRGLLDSTSDATRLGAAPHLGAVRQDELADVEQRIAKLEKQGNELPSTTGRA